MYKTFQEVLNEQGYGIVACRREHKIGDLVPQVYDDLHRTTIRQPFVITRVATVEEYLVQGKWLERLEGPCFYYEVRTD